MKRLVLILTMLFLGACDDNLVGGSLKQVSGDSSLNHLNYLEQEDGAQGDVPAGTDSRPDVTPDTGTDEGPDLSPPDLPDPPCECGDTDPCTVDHCNEAGECIHEQVNCDDGNPCTTDACKDGVCMNVALNCDDGDACTKDVCTEGECVFTFICECTTDEDCDDDSDCTGDYCNEGYCTHTGSPDCTCVEDDDCDDGNPCTTQICHDGECLTVESEGCPCVMDGGENYDPKYCPQDDNPCTENLCILDDPWEDQFNGHCVVYEAQTGTPCDDGDPCTHSDTCKDMACTGTPVCDDNNSCTIDICIGDGEGCTFEPIDCDDGDPCTDDWCDGGKCKHLSSGDPRCQP